MNILAIDLGTKLGYARRSRGVMTSGTVSFAPKVRDGRGRRWANFRAWLSQIAQDADIGAIYYEDVKRHGPGQVLAAHVYGGFLAHLELWAEINRIPLHAVGVGTIKRHWTGKGNAKKADMVRVARERGLRPADDNEADALALLDYAICDQGEPTRTAIEVVAARADERTVDMWASPFEVSA